MMFLMLTPSLACAMTICASDTAAQETTSSEKLAPIAQKPCHEMASHKAPSANSEAADNKQQPLKGVMLALDCMGVDLFHNSASFDVIDQPEMAVISNAFWIDYDIASTAIIHKTQLSRAPPQSPERLLVAATQQSLYLTTGRLRI